MSHRYDHEKNGQAKFEKLRKEAGKRIAPAHTSQLEDDEGAAHVQAAQRTSRGRAVNMPRIYDVYL